VDKGRAVARTPPRQGQSLSSLHTYICALSDIQTHCSQW